MPHLLAVHHKRNRLKIWLSCLDQLRRFKSVLCNVPVMMMDTTNINESHRMDSKVRNTTIRAQTNDFAGELTDLFHRQVGNR